MKKTSALGLIALAALVSSCTDEEPIVLKSDRIPSPDSTRELIVEHIDNGLGFGMGRNVVEMHVQDAGTPVTFHGDGSATVVFYVVEEHAADPPVIKWVGGDRVTVSYSNVNQPGKKLEHFMGVNFEYSAKSENEP